MLATQRDPVRIKAGNLRLEGMLEMPSNPSAVVLFFHGSGSIRLSPRNNYVARELRRAALGTLLIDLFSLEEDQKYRTRFNISLLTDRLTSAIGWLHDYDGTRNLPICLFGTSAGAAAALHAAVLHSSLIAAVVSRGGRPDLAGQKTLENVLAPTLLIVGGRDDIVIELNRAAYAILRCEKRLEIIPAATHLFEEAGALEQVAELARNWFARHVQVPTTSPQ